MLKHRYGLTAKEDAVISFLIDKKINFIPLFYNSAIPIKELFYFFVIAGNSFYEFNRIPDFLSELQKLNVLQFDEIDTKDLQKIRQLIRGVDDKSGILIKLSNESDKEQWGNVKPEGKQFAIEVFPLGERYVVSALQLRKLYGGITIQMKVLHSEISDNELHAVRLFKPEQYIPFCFMESDLDGIENLLPRMQNLFYAYQVMRYRMIKYYANFVGVEPIQNSMKKIDGFCRLSTHLKDKGNVKSNCFALLHELNQEDIWMMNILKEKLGVKK